MVLRRGRKSPTGAPSRAHNPRIKENNSVTIKYACIITFVVINYASIVIEYMGRFPSGQRGQTVNLLQLASMVRIHLCPLKNLKSYDLRFFALFFVLFRYYHLIGLFSGGGKHRLPCHRIRPALCIKAITDTSAVVVELASYR